MRLTATVIMMTARTVGLMAAERSGEPRNVTVCAELGSAGPVAYAARSLASRIFAEINIRIEWRPANSCAGIDNALAVSVSENTPENQLRGALAYALPFEGTHIVVFYDRIKREAEGPLAPRLFAYVVVHEITHILQRTARHSADGIMKAQYSKADYIAMMRRGLHFDCEDIELIYLGMDWRPAR